MAENIPSHLVNDFFLVTFFPYSAVLILYIYIYIYINNVMIVHLYLTGNPYPLYLKGHNVKKKVTVFGHFPTL